MTGVGLIAGTEGIAAVPGGYVMAHGADNVQKGVATIVNALPFDDILPEGSAIEYIEREGVGRFFGLIGGEKGRTFGKTLGEYLYKCQDIGVSLYSSGGAFQSLLEKNSVRVYDSILKPEANFFRKVIIKQPKYCLPQTYLIDRNWLKAFSALGLSLDGSSYGYTSLRELITKGEFIGAFPDLLTKGKNLVEPFLETEFGEHLSNMLDNLLDIFHTAEITKSPLILDLDGDGVETTLLKDGINFDHDNNGFAEKSAWVGKDDGLLVRDINGNGIIDSGKELFGNNTLLNDGTKAANGFAALAELDDNRDGKIDINDAIYSQLRVWKDANGDGVTNTGELITLMDAGIASINTGYRSTTVVDDQGNDHKQTGTFTKADGTTGAIDDVWFKTDAIHSTSTNLIEETIEIANLPELKGFGNVRSLHQTMMRDSSKRL
ncbi:hypothetical protein [Clostridium sp. ZS2-4]|uniref:hypothetical protein n=1 Tax=Clostridium sp. ZS2-4 TaxID=2987703 RepID=UPI00227CA3D3|nr:hypothetical protein [Clostridium sp. ZS2-4]MCY6355659.1 hypothetical protein [Clostridium sp. ZS2-4]